MPHVLHVSEQIAPGSSPSPVAQVRSNRAHPCFRFLRREPTSLDRPYPSRIHARQLEPSRRSRHRPPEPSSPAHPRALITTRSRRGRVFAVAFLFGLRSAGCYARGSRSFATRFHHSRFAANVSLCLLFLCLSTYHRPPPSSVLRIANVSLVADILISSFTTSLDNVSFPFPLRVSPPPQDFSSCGGNDTQVPPQDHQPAVQSLRT
jgi:hypothetical protein